MIDQNLYLKTDPVIQLLAKQILKSEILKRSDSISNPVQIQSVILRANLLLFILLQTINSGNAAHNYIYIFLSLSKITVCCYHATPF